MDALAPLPEDDANRMRRSSMWQPQCRSLATVLVVVLLLIGALASAQTEQDATGWAAILSNLETLIGQNYFDPNFGGVNLRARFSQAEESLPRAPTSDDIHRALAEALRGIPGVHAALSADVSPGLSYETAWRAIVLGDRVFVSCVQPNSDALAKGLRPGDELLLVEGARPTREALQNPLGWRGMPGSLEVTHLEVASPGEQPRQIEIRTPRPPLPAEPYLVFSWPNLVGEDAASGSCDAESKRPADLSLRGYTGRGSFVPDAVDLSLAWACWAEMLCGVMNVGRSVAVIAAPTQAIFAAADAGPTPRWPPSPRPGWAYRAFVGSGNSKASDFAALIFDLRGNYELSEQGLLNVAAMLFDHDVKLADRVGRENGSALVAKADTKKCYLGKVVVYVDASTRGFAELLARAVQLEKRGIVVGDRTAGRVASTISVPLHLAQRPEQWLVADIATTDFVPSDGKSLEGVGVIPDQILLPTPAQLASGETTAVLVQVLQQAGLKDPPEKIAAMLRRK